MLNRLLAELKSLLFMKWMLLKHRKSICGEGDYAATVAAQDEIEQIQLVTTKIFNPNLFALNHSDYALAAFKYMYDTKAVDAMFLQGIFVEFLERQPTLSPTPIPDRAAIYAMTFYTKHMGMTFLDARDFILKANATCNSQTLILPLRKALELGRLAYRDGGDQHLIAAHAFVKKSYEYQEFKAWEKREGQHQIVDDPPRL
jgi:hypothetical protein